MAWRPIGLRRASTGRTASLGPSARALGESLIVRWFDWIGEIDVEEDALRAGRGQPVDQLPRRCCRGQGQLPIWRSDCRRS